MLNGLRSSSHISASGKDSCGHYHIWEWWHVGLSLVLSLDRGVLEVWSEGQEQGDVWVPLWWE